MQILCVADIHGSRENLLEVKRYAENNNPERILFLGDFPGHSSFRDSRKSLEEARFVLDTLSSFEMLAIPGNCDSPEILNLFEEYGVNLHEKSIILDETALVGFGGSSPTPFNSPFEMAEEVLYEKLEKLLEGVTKGRVAVAVHTPPFNTMCDIRASGDHVGSRAVRSIIEKFQPDVLLCSHIHESGGSMDALGRTQIANIGSLLYGRIGVLHLDDDVNMELSVL